MAEAALHHRSFPAIASVPRCPQSTCACFPGAVSKGRTATTRAELRCGHNQSVRIAGLRMIMVRLVFNC